MMHILLKMFLIIIFIPNLLFANNNFFQEGINLYNIKKFDDDPVSYTTRLIDCHHDAFIKISDGSSFSEMEKNYGPPGNLIPISRKSILYQLRESVCGVRVKTESSSNTLTILE